MVTINVCMMICYCNIPVASWLVQGEVAVHCYCCAQCYGQVSGAGPGAGSNWTVLYPAPRLN